MSKRTKFQKLDPNQTVLLPAYRLAERVYWYQVSQDMDANFQEIYEQIYQWMMREQKKKSA